MLNQYLPLDLLKQELIKRDYFLQRVTHDEGWKGGPLVVPFQVQQASTIEFGQLADQLDISRYKYARGLISYQPEAWASIILDHKDLIQHDGRIPESTFLRILPDQIDAMLNRFRMVLSTHVFANTGAIARVTANGTSAGVLGVSRIDRFELDQKVVLNDDGTAGQKIVYIIGININMQTIVVSLARGGVAVDVSAYTTAHSARVFNPGSLTMGMTSLGSQLLPASAGGPATIFGVDKLTAPYTQAIAVESSDVTSTNILSKIFDAYSLRQTLAKSGELPEAVMSFKNFGNVLKQIELVKGAFNVVPQSRKVSVYGWQTVEIGSVNGSVMKIVAIQECPDDVIWMLDWSGIMFYSNGMIRRRKSPDGLEFYENRATSGYTYIVDHFIMGDCVVTAPWKQLVMYNINYT
jgi:hypothetical protein